MSKADDMLQAEMLEKIKSGGAWFTTRIDHFVKIRYDEFEDCYYARECFFNEGKLEGGAYTFGTDWFDISFHGRGYIDIYADPDSFQSWETRSTRAARTSS